MPRKKKYKFEVNVDIVPCLFKHDEDWTCLNPQSGMFDFVPSNTYCNKCPFREEYDKDDKRLRK